MPWRKREDSSLTFRHRGIERYLILTPLKTLTLGITGLLILSSLIVSGAFIFLRDDLLSASLTRQAKMKTRYESRINSLRSEIDFIKTKQLSAQRGIEHRVRQLILRQKELNERERHLSLSMGGNRKSSRRKDRKRNKKVAVTTNGLRLGSFGNQATAFTTGSVVASAIDTTPNMIKKFEVSLAETERAQIDELLQLRKSTIQKTKKLASILSRQGIRIPGSNGLGGPLIELKAGDNFLNSVNALEASLKTLEKVRKAAKSLPHGSPTPGRKISSTFGSRKDPFTGRHAVHGGLDFRAKRGTSVRVTASGKIVKASRAGGYGKLIEVDHGGGITTRYAHLSKIRVRVGQYVTRGTRIGNVGSTGRSTGPHLHYEVRRKGRVLNPIHYVRLEKHLRPYL